MNYFWNFLFNILNLVRPCVTETTESENTGKEGAKASADAGDSLNWPRPAAPDPHDYH